LNCKKEWFSNEFITFYEIRYKRKSLKYIYIYIKNIYNGLNRTFRAATVREFRSLTSTGSCGRSDRRILLKPEPTGSYRKELSYEHMRIQIQRLDLEKCQIQIWTKTAPVTLNDLKRRLTEKAYF